MQDSGSEAIPSCSSGQVVLCVDNCTVVRVALPDTSDEAEANGTETPIADGTLHVIALPPPPDSVDKKHTRWHSHITSLKTKFANVAYNQAPASSSQAQAEAQPKYEELFHLALAITSPNGKYPFFCLCPPGTRIVVTIGSTVLMVPDPEQDAAVPAKTVCGIVFGADGIQDVARCLQKKGRCKVLWEAHKEANTVGNATVSAGAFLARGIIGASEIVGKGARYASKRAVSSNLIQTEEVSLPSEATNGVKLARQGSLMVSSAARFVVTGVGTVAGKAAAAVHDRMPDLTEQWQQDAKVVGKSALEASVTVWGAVRDASRHVAAEVADATSEVAGHRFGDEVGTATREGLHTVGNVYYATSFMSLAYASQVVAVGTGQGLVDSVDQTCQSVEPAMLPPLAEQEDVTFSFQPGKLGLDADWSSGRITGVIPGGQGQKCGVEVGWVMTKVNDEDYSEAALDRCINGRSVYHTTFHGKPSSVIMSAVAGTGRDLGDSLNQTCQLVEAATLPSPPEQEGVTFSFQPGLLALDADWSTGRITGVIPGGQGQKCGVEIGWIMTKVNDEDYSEAALDRCINGRLVYYTKFIGKPNPTIVNVAAAGTGQGLVDSLNQTYQLVEPTLLPPSPEQEDVTFSFQPGKLGLDADWSTGRITGVIPGGQGQKCVVEVGWIMTRLNDEAYSEAALDRCINGRSMYRITFSGKAKSAIISQGQDSRNEHEEH